jgi:hypothetical protein
VWLSDFNANAIVRFDPVTEPSPRSRSRMSQVMSARSWGAAARCGAESSAGQVLSCGPAESPHGLDRRYGERPVVT